MPEILCSSCKQKKLSVITSCAQRRCSFHPRGKTFSMEKLAPDRLCLEAFFRLYPYCFAALYQKEFTPYRVHCPKVENGVTFQVFRKPQRFTRRLMNYIKTIIAKLYPLDIIRYRIFIEVLSQQHDCLENHAPGQQFELNLNQKTTEACPAAFHNVFPSFFAGTCTENTLQPITSACPDHCYDIQLTLNPKINKNLLPSGSLECAAYEHFTLAIPFPEESHQKFPHTKLQTISELLGEIRCLGAFWAIFPYYLTLLEDGEMTGFYSKHRHSAYVQCPSIEHKVEMLIEKKEGIYVLRIGKTKNPCPKGLVPGMEIALSDEKNKLVLQTLHSIVPYALALSNLSLSNINIYSPDPKKQFIIEIKK